MLLGGWIETLKALRMVNSVIEELADNFELLADMDTLVIISEMELFQCTFLSLNLAKFRADHIEDKILIIADAIDSLH